MKLYGIPDNNILQKGAIIKPSIREATQIKHNVIHTPITYTTEGFINTSKICGKPLQPPLKSHLNYTIM